MSTIAESTVPTPSHLRHVTEALKTKDLQFDDFFVTYGAITCHKTTYGTTSDDKFDKLSILCFQWNQVKIGSWVLDLLMRQSDLTQWFLRDLNEIWET